MFRRVVGSLAVLALLAPFASAQTVDEILARHVAARGGMQKLAATKTMRQTGKMILPNGMELPITVYAKRPRSSRVEFLLGGMTGLQVCDGTMAWSAMPMMGKKNPEPMSPEQTKDMLVQADFDGPLVDSRAKGNAIELVGKEQVEGADAFKLMVTPKGDVPRFIYLDAASYLEVKIESRRTMQGQVVEGESFLRDYRDEGGVMVAHTIENGTRGGAQKQKLVIEKVEINVDVPDSLFAMPGVAPVDSSKAAGARPAAAAGAKKVAATKPKKK